MGGVRSIPNWTSCHSAYGTFRKYSVFNILSWLRATHPKLILKAYALTVPGALITENPMEEAMINSAVILAAVKRGFNEYITPM